VIASIALWWVTIFKRGRVVIISKDSRQIDEQTWPSIERHKGKFDPKWKWNDRECTTVTGSKIITFTTDDPLRCEGFHRGTHPDGTPDPEAPLLLIVNEAKGVDEGMFEAFDRCTYDALLYASSPGKMTGRFYDSQFIKEKGFKTVRVGLKDCPHIPKERIDDIRNTYGADSAFARSTLDGEFMEAEGESRFDLSGLKLLQDRAKERFKLGTIGVFEEQDRFGTRPQWMQDPENGWAWKIEDPIPGCRYVAAADPNTGEQSEGSKERDSTTFCIIRDAYMDTRGRHHNAEVVCTVHVTGGCKWDMDIVAERLHRMAKFYGDCIIIVEANNYGGELIRLLRQSGAALWRREKQNAVKPGKKLEVYGFLSTGTSKSQWVGALAAYIREETLDCDYLPAVNEFSTFIINERGNGAAQDGAHDDWVTCIGLGLLILPTCGTSYLPMQQRIEAQQYPGVMLVEEHREMSGHGACN